MSNAHQYKMVMPESMHAVTLHILRIFINLHIYLKAYISYFCIYIDICVWTIYEKRDQEKQTEMIHL